MTKTTQYSFHSTVLSGGSFSGEVFSVIAEGDTVRASGFTADRDMLAGMAKLDPAEVTPSKLGHPALDAAARYFSGELAAIDTVAAVEAIPPSPFRQASRDALRKIPAGQIRTYTQLAAAAGNPTAVRAAANGCATNPLALFVPCHRVLRSDGSLGGFLYGLDVKARLIEHERVHSAG